MSSMRQYILKRLLLMPITLIGITFLVFFLTRMVPGGPVERMLQEQSIGALSGEKTVGQMNGVNVNRSHITASAINRRTLVYIFSFALMGGKFDSEREEDGRVYHIPYISCNLKACYSTN